uniref:Immunoglobulin V-set domain-containing protein n=1 Tax=Anabas testudineus TaxID=64144 RepID=A0A3Q1IQ04_ANATE
SWSSFLFHLYYTSLCTFLQDSPTSELNVFCLQLRWYRQHQRSRPEFLLSITEGGLIHPPDPDFPARLDKTEKCVDLEIISAKVSDSAVYYCALQPTVTGNSKTLKETENSTTSTRGTHTLFNFTTSVFRQKQPLLFKRLTVTCIFCLFPCFSPWTSYRQTNTLYLVNLLQH